jgi:riboflavin biosynthesis pyrimidine reductase
MRPKIVCHMITSIDGKIHASRWSPLADPRAHNGSSTYETIAKKFESQGWLVGRVTMQEMLKTKPREIEGAPRAPDARSPQTHIGDRGEGSLAIVVDAKGKLTYEKSHLHGEHVVAILAEDVGDEYLQHLRDHGVSYTFAGHDGSDLAQAMTSLRHHFGVHTLLLEGGSTINGAFLKASLIDEFSVLIYPGIDGLDGVQSMVGYRGPPEEKPAKKIALRLVHVEQLSHGYVWSRYAVMPEV